MINIKIENRQYLAAEFFCILKAYLYTGYTELATPFSRNNAIRGDEGPRSTHKYLCSPGCP